MSKTLTEQWLEGTLPDDTYYWKVCKENWIADKYEMYDYTKVCDVNKIECLAPVPSYEECCLLTKKAERADYLDEKLKYYTPEECLIIKGLEKKLAIATKALNDIRDVWANNPNKFSYIARIANRKAKTALEEMEGVK